LHLSKVVIIVIAVVVVAAVVLAGLWAAGVGPFAPASSGSGNPGGGNGGSGETYSQAVLVAQPAARGISGGPWTAGGGAGVQLTSSFSINATELNQSFNFGCGGKILSGASSLTSFPATSSAPSSGDSTMWIIVFENASAGFLEVAVFNGVATPVFTLASFGLCGYPSGIAKLPANAVDSPIAAATAWAAGGPAYAANHSSYETEYIVLNSTTDGALWVVTYTNCNPTETGATLDGNAPAQFTAIVWATNGTLRTKDSTTTACPTLKGGGGGGGGGKASIDSCRFVSAQANVTGTYWYNASAICPFNVTKMTTGDLRLSAVNNTTGTPVSTTGWSLVVQNVSSFPFVNASHYNFATKTWNDTTYPILALVGGSDYWVLTTPTSVSGDRITITATASAPCTGSFDWYLNQNL
jgi:hypothetical protein